MASSEPMKSRAPAVANLVVQPSWRLSSQSKTQRDELRATQAGILIGTCMWSCKAEIRDTCSAASHTQNSLLAADLTLLEPMPEPMRAA